ncbi:hypothetical protein AQUCO_02400105v1 [Aquilegia coerulea]|uniref:Transcriptional coactivator Hfi1/Transcriptional adapter 1 n=1 Tax=Aquilegia coerulea TaxID=218851 RepID=A0A2G5DBG1_AQUCA|nr:hypothetical protein AQUCO_02400105v1 [Aquilegia coerulea]
MQPLQQQQSRINLTDLKTQIVKKLGPDRSKRYFYFLNRLLSQKLSKGEFDKLCLRILGRENLSLHNHLVRSILKNVSHAKVPPPIYEKEAPLKSTLVVAKKSPFPEDGYQQSGSLPTQNSCQNSLIWSNGDVLPMSPRKSRSGIRERRSRDRPSPLGQNGKTDLSVHSTTTPDDGSGKVITENGDFKSYDVQRPVQHRQGLAEQLDNEREALLQRPTKRPRTKKSPDDTVSVHSKGPVEVDGVNGFEMAQQGSNSSYARSPLRAPLGIPFCSASIGGARKAMPASNSNSFAVSSDSGVLFDTETLRRRMEQIVGAQGLEGVSADCANLLNNGLDVYLKRLIRSCIELVGSRSQEPAKPPVHKQQSHGKHINGIKPEYQLQMQNGGGPIDCIQVPRTQCRISLLDFKVAMELNPQQLGEDWPLLLEKICMHEYEE